MQGPPAFHRRFQARLDAGTREFRGSDAAPDSFTSFKRSATAWDRDAGVARALDRAIEHVRGAEKGHGSVQHPADREPGARGWRARATRSDARGRARRDRCIAEAVPASAFRAWARRSRAPTPGPRRVGRRGTNLFSVEAETRTHLVASVESPYPPRATLSRVSRGERRRLRVYTPRRGPLLDRCRRLWLGGGRFRAIRRRPASTSQPRTHSARDAQMV